jgi:hypothetical protein
MLAVVAFVWLPININLSPSLSLLRALFPKLTKARTEKQQRRYYNTNSHGA